MDTALLLAMTWQEVATAAYWFALVVGGGLLIFSAFGGDHEHGEVGGADGVDVDADAAFGADLDAVHADLDFGHADFDADADGLLHSELTHVHEAAGLSTWFSLRFVIFTLATFGVVGVVLTYLSSWNPGLVLALAVAGGLGVGQAVHQLFRMLRRTADSAPQPADYVRKLARVTIPIRPPDRGEVAVQVRGTRRCVPAVTGQGRGPFERGDEVVIVSYRAGVVSVVAREEFEQQHTLAQGG